MVRSPLRSSLHKNNRVMECDAGERDNGSPVPTPSYPARATPSEFEQMGASSGI